MEDKLIEKLRYVMEEKGHSAEMAARFIDCSGKQVYLWLAYKANPTRIYRKAIQKGIKRMEGLARL